MMGFGMSSSANMIAATHVHVVALYDGRTGTIKYLHTVTTLGKGTPLSQEAVVKQAKANAVRHVADVDQLETATSADPAHGLTTHRIDLATKDFVPSRASTSTQTP